MDSSGALARQGDGHRLRPVLPRFLAIVQAPKLDDELAAGLRPSATPAHQARANHLRRPRVRRRIASALERAVRAASRPPCYEPAKAPLDRQAIRRSHGEILALARLVTIAEKPRTQGIAIAFRLAFDGGAALFFHPDTANAVDRLANTVNAAHTALRVSGDFDAA